MPEKKTIERARRDKEQGKAPTTQAGEFIREEMEHVKEGKHGAKSRKQVIAIGLSKARRAGVDLPPPPKGKAPEKTRRSAAQARRAGQEKGELGERSTTAKRPARRTTRTSTKAAATKKRGSSSTRAGSRSGRSREKVPATGRKVVRGKAAPGAEHAPSAPRRRAKRSKR